MKRLLITTDLLFFLSSSFAVYFYFFISPVQNNQPNLMIIGVFLTSLFVAIASGTTLVLYSPHLILRRKLHTGRTKDFLWKPVFAASFRRGLILGIIITGNLLLNLLGQGGLVNRLLLTGIFVLLEIYFSRVV